MINLAKVAECVTLIANTSGRLDKIDMLVKFASVTGFKEVLCFIYDPYIKTGIAATKLKKTVAPINVEISVRDFINHFKAHQTGSDADVALAKSFIAQQETQEAKTLAAAMAIKTLKIGVTENTLNQVYGDDFIPKIGIMRGEHYKDVKSKVTGPFIVTEKLDGARRLLVKENGVVTMYSRSGHMDEGLVDIEAEAKYLPDNSVLDGELLAIGEFDNSVALRQATNSIANSKGKRGGLTYNVFDMIALQEFKVGRSTHGANVRKTLIAAMFGDDGLKHLVPDNWQQNLDLFGVKRNFSFIKAVPILGVVNTEEEIMALAQPIWDRHFEGLMLNTYNGIYEISASPRRQLLKVKATEEFSLTCTGMFEGEGRLAGMMGGVYLDYKGNQVGCGSGFNDQQRKYYWANRDKIVGKLIEGDSFGESTNQAGGISLNCPIFKRVVGTVE